MREKSVGEWFFFCCVAVGLSSRAIDWNITMFFFWGFLVMCFFCLKCVMDDIMMMLLMNDREMSAGYAVRIP